MTPYVKEAPTLSCYCSTDHNSQGKGVGMITPELKRKFTVMAFHCPSYLQPEESIQMWYQEVLKQASEGP